MNVHCACAGINEAPPRFTSFDFKTSDQTQRQQLDRDDTSKIIKFLDYDNPFEVNSATQHSLHVVAHESGIVTCSTVRTKDP